MSRGNQTPPTPVQAWSDRRKAALKRYGLWGHYGQVPPISERDQPIEAYLPEGECYE